MQLQIWEWILLIGASYVAVLSLNGLMRRKRAQIVDQLTQQAVKQQNERKAAEKQQLKEERKKQIAEAKRRKAA